MSFVDMNAQVKTPTLVIDEEKCRNNIQRMYDKAVSNGVELRPHFKTHQSLEIGGWFKEAGVSKITVSSLRMAKYFAEDWNDILVAFPVNIHEIDAINDLASTLNLHLSIENLDSLRFLSQHIQHPVNIYIQVDVGYNRTGVSTENEGLINSILSVVNQSSLMHFVGFYAHAGHSYNTTSSTDVERIHSASLRKMAKLKETYPSAVISLGDTPTCSIAKDFKGVDEIRPGNFVFYDLMQHQIGSNTISQIAVALACPIVAIHKDRLEMVIYGGGVHFSKDRLEDVEGTIYGRVVQKSISGWGDLIPGMYVKRLSQEHGIIALPKHLIDRYSIGDYVFILPVHSCMTANLVKVYTTLKAKAIPKLS